jgi:hypothetical protein
MIRACSSPLRSLEDEGHGVEGWDALVDPEGGLEGGVEKGAESGVEPGNGGEDEPGVDLEIVTEYELGIGWGIVPGEELAAGPEDVTSRKI